MGHGLHGQPMVIGIVIWLGDRPYLSGGDAATEKSVSREYR